MSEEVVFPVTKRNIEAQLSVNELVREDVETHRDLRKYFVPSKCFCINVMDGDHVLLDGTIFECTREIQFRALKAYVMMRNTIAMTDALYFNMFYNVIITLALVNMKRIVELTEDVDKQRYTKLWYDWHSALRLSESRVCKIYGTSFICDFTPGIRNQLMKNRSVRIDCNIREDTMFTYEDLVTGGIYPAHLNMAKCIEYMMDKSTDYTKKQAALSWSIWANPKTRTTTIHNLPKGIEDTIYLVFTVYKLNMDLARFILQKVVIQCPVLEKIRVGDRHWYKEEYDLTWEVRPKVVTAKKRDRQR